MIGGSGLAAVGAYGAYSSLRNDADSRDFDAGRIGDVNVSTADEPEEYEARTRSGSMLRGITPTERNVERLEPIEAWVGEPHAVIGFFIDMGQSHEEIERLVLHHLQATWERGQVPHVFWQPFFPADDDTSSEINREIASGRYDETIKTWAEILSAWVYDEDGHHRRVYLNLAPEFNGDWSPWSPAVGDDSEEDFVAMWRHIHDIVSDTGLTSEFVQWIWTLDNTTRNVDREACYPGDDYVDWCGIHGYNWTTWIPWQTPSEVYDETISFIRSVADKPIAITEFGSSSETEDDERDPQKKNEWIADTYDYMEDEDIRLSLYFNVERETDWAVFDSEYGPAQADIDGESVNVYPAYREAMRSSGMLGPHPDHPRVLTDEEFAGKF